MAMHLDKTFDHRLAWLAGIIDGEGWLGFGFRDKVWPNGRKYKYMAWYVAIGNTAPAMLTEVMAIADILGLKYTFQLADARRENYKEQRRVSFGSKKACYEVLRAVLPYLVNKRPHAELMLRAMEHRYGKDPAALNTRNSFNFTVFADPELQEMTRQIRRMNHRGFHPDDKEA